MTTEALAKKQFSINRDWYAAVMEELERKKWPARFEAKPTPWFPGISERCIEIPWAISRYAGQKNVLEVGLSLADMTLVSAQVELKKVAKFDLSALDIVDINRVRNRFINLEEDVTSIFKFHQGDARQSSFDNNTFDLIFIISTIEHIGFDEFNSNSEAGTVFNRPKDLPTKKPEYRDDDKKVLAELKRILSPGGSILLTVPMGNGGITYTQDSKGLYWFYKEYSASDWKKLVDESGLHVVEQRFFRDGGAAGWIEEGSAAGVDGQAGTMLAQAKGVACAELKKK